MVTNIILTFAPLFQSKGALAHLARAFDWQSRGGEFESRMLHKSNRKPAELQRVFYFPIIILTEKAELLNYTMETFNTVIRSGQLVLVDFFATWCGPCKAMHPVLEQLKAQLGDRLRIIKVDIDKHGDPAVEYGVQAVPTLMLFRNGEVLWRQSGAMPLNQLINVITPFLA